MIFFYFPILRLLIEIFSFLIVPPITPILMITLYPALLFLLGIISEVLNREGKNIYRKMLPVFLILLNACSEFFLYIILICADGDIFLELIPFDLLISTIAILLGYFISLLQYIRKRRWYWKVFLPSIAICWDRGKKKDKERFLIHLILTGGFPQDENY